MSMSDQQTWDMFAALAINALAQKHWDVANVIGSRQTAAGDAYGDTALCTRICDMAAAYADEMMALRAARTSKS